MTLPIAKTLAQNTRALRTMLGLTQAELARAADVTVETIARLERVLRNKPSANANPSLETMQSIADALGTTVPELLVGGKPERGVRKRAAEDRRKLDAVRRIVGERS